jgi:hypothetical protein
MKSRFLFQKRRILWKSIRCLNPFYCAVSLLWLLFPSLGSAQDVFNVTCIAPGYTATDFVRQPVNTAAIEFENVGNIYTSDGELGPGLRLVTISKYPAGSDYTFAEEYGRILYPEVRQI